MNETCIKHNEEYYRQERDKQQSQLKLLVEALEESHALNVNVFSEAEPEMLSYYSEYKAVIALAAAALKEMEVGRD